MGQRMRQHWPFLKAKTSPGTGLVFDRDLSHDGVASFNRLGGLVL